jgi:hypothetical protein
VLQELAELLRTCRPEEQAKRMRLPSGTSSSVVSSSGSLWSPARTTDGRKLRLIEDGNLEPLEGPAGDGR